MWVRHHTSSTHFHLLSHLTKEGRTQPEGICPGSPGGVGVSLQGVEVEERRSQTHGNVGWSHLVLVHTGHHIPQEEEQRTQRFPVLIREKQDGRLGRHHLLVLGKV